MRGTANYVFAGKFTLSECDPDMIEQATEIKYVHFRNNCIGLAEYAKTLDYGSGHSLKDDQMCQYRLSRVGGKRVMYMIRQRIVYLWREKTAEEK